MVLQLSASGITQKKKITQTYKLQEGIEEGKQAVKKVFESNPIYYKFNLDERQTTSFIGVPTPANALFWGCLLYTSWSTIERLNRERELVGIYLSAHPLDEYKMCIRDSS